MRIGKTNAIFGGSGGGGEVVLNFVPFVAPESFDHPSKYADYGCTVNLHEKLKIYKMTYPDADIAVEFSDAIESVQIPAGPTIEIFETVLGVERSVLITTSSTITHPFTSGSTKRYMIRCVSTVSNFSFPIGSVWAYCCGIKHLAEVTYVGSYLKYIFFHENTLTNLWLFHDSAITGTLRINDGITNIYGTIFRRCNNLTKVITGDSVSTIGTI